MPRVPSARVLANALVVALLVSLVATQAFQAFATHTPADKAVASGETIDEVPQGPTPGAGTSANTIIGPVRVRNAKTTDLQLHVSLECSILTEATSSTANLESTAEGEIRVWVVIDNTKIVPIDQFSSPPQNPGPGGSDIDKVTFCNRAHELEQTDAEMENGAVDTTRSFIETKDANAFNWVLLNVGNGIHTIEVRADFDSSTTGGGVASGFVGNRTLLVDPTKMANDIAV